MPRPRKIREEDLIDAAVRVIDRSGLFGFTLAKVAREAGVTAPLLMQRFGSKRGLLLALTDATAPEIDAAFARAAKENASALVALHEALVALSQPTTPRALANGLAFLRLDVTDPAFHDRARRFLQALHKATRALLDKAVKRGELRRCDTDALARAIEVAYNGSLLSWAIRQDGSAEEALRRDVEATLASLRTKRRGRAAPTRPARRPPAAARPSRGK